MISPNVITFFAIFFFSSKYISYLSLSYLFLIEAVNFTASSVSALISSNFPAFTRSPFTIQLPPQAMILSQLK
ncbi:hypothetical protein EVA_16816 [gut metagenome]|uniref:Uncharacterized protein n=1 Tax=gut metagenome TaxID=749906 RepID=J9FJL7_9ZZZZ